MQNNKKRTIRVFKAKSKGHVFSGYKQRNKVYFLNLECELQQDGVWLMHFHIQMPENGRKNIFTEKQTINKVPLIFLDVKVLGEMEQLRFSTVVYVSSVLKPENKQLKRSTVVRTPKPNCRSYFSRLKSRKIGAADVVTSLTGKNSRNNVFRNKKNNKQGTL